MINNKPKYSLFKNGKYALDGLVYVCKSENSFRMEIFFGFFSLIALILVDIELSYKLILLITLFIVFIAELLNSAVENVVDLVTKDIHPLAKSAKDIGAAAVLFALILHVGCWVLILLN